MDQLVNRLICSIESIKHLYTVDNYEAQLIFPKESMNDSFHYSSDLLEPMTYGILKDLIPH